MTAPGAVVGDLAASRRTRRALTDAARPADPWTLGQLAALVVVLALGVFVLGWRLGTSGWSVDEPVYRDAGTALVEDGDLSPNREHPLVGKVLIGTSIALVGEGEVGTRLASTVAGFVVGVAVLGLGASMAGRWAGLAGAALWWLLPLAPGTTVARIDRYGLLEPPMLAFAMVGLWLAWTWSRRGSWGWGLAAGVAVGLAAATKLTGALVLPAVLLAGWWAPGASAPNRRRIGATAFPLVGAAAGFLVPALAFGTAGWSALRFAVEWQLDHAAEGHAQVVAGTSYLHPPWWAPWWFQAEYLTRVGTAALWLLAALGAVLAWRTGGAARRGTAFLLTALVPVVAAVSLSGLKLPHYHVAWVPLLCVLAGMGLALALPRRDAWRAVGAAAGAVLVVLAAGQLWRIATLEPRDYAALPDALAGAGVEVDGATVAVWGYDHLAAEALPDADVVAEAPRRVAGPTDVVLVDPVVAERQPDSPFASFVDELPGSAELVRVGRLDVWVLP